MWIESLLEYQFSMHSAMNLHASAYITHRSVKALDAQTVKAARDVGINF